VGLGIALIFIALGIGYDSVLRLNDPGMLLKPGMLALAVALVSVASKEWIYHYTVRAARRLRSDMLMANAWHSRSDAISSIVVVIGIAGAMFGYPYLDAVAAVAVAAMIAKIGFDLVRSSTKELIDTGLGVEDIEKIRGHIFEVAGVRAVHMLRTRKSAGDAFVDVHIQVDPRVSVSEGHQIGETVRRRLLDEVDMVSDVTVHIDPEDDEAESPCDDLPSREAVLEELKKYWSQLPEAAIDEVTLHYLSGEIHVELVLPIGLLGSTSEASSFVDGLKAAVVPLPYISDLQVQFRP
jgi:cation diffusion facilitator family transporter